MQKANLVNRKGYVEVTKLDLNTHVPNLICFGTDATFVNPVISDLYNMFEINREHLERGEQFKPYLYVDTKKDLAMALILLRMPYASAAGKNSYEKVANVLFNLLVINTDIDYRLEDIEIKFNGYNDSNLITTHLHRVSEVSEEKMVMKYLISNIRTLLANLSINHATVLSRSPFQLEKVTHLDIPFLDILCRTNEVIKENTKTKANSKMEKNREGDTQQYFKSNFGDVLRMPKHKLMDPNALLAIAKGDARHKERVNYSTEKQVIILNIDNSGSMNSIAKLSRVVAIATDVLAKVVEGTAEVHINWYEATIVNSLVARTEKEAKDVMSFITRNVPSGGGTNIGASLQTIINQAIDAKLKEPHVIIILDGDDVVDPNSVELKEVKVSTFLLGKSNSGVEELCNKSGGFVRIDPLYSTMAANI